MAQDGIRGARESLKVFLREALPENDPIPGVGIHPHDAGTYDDATEETLRSLAAYSDSRCQANLTPRSPRTPASYQSSAHAVEHS